jgi:hypothetical protein
LETLLSFCVFGSGFVLLFFLFLNTLVLFIFLVFFDYCT